MKKLSFINFLAYSVNGNLLKIVADIPGSYSPLFIFLYNNQILLNVYSCHVTHSLCFPS